MKKLSFLSIISLLFVSINTFSIDIVVESGGVSPAYGSISAAVAAASNGDRIIIKNRPGNIPWIENVILDKSLELLSFENDTFFVVQGNYTIQGFAGMEVNIVGMRNLVGNVIGSGNITGGTGKVMIMDSKFESGYLLFNYNNYHLTVAGCEFLDGYIEMEQGGVYGCSISGNYSFGLILVASSLVTLADKSIDIIGNKLANTGTSSASSGIQWSSNQAFLNATNNYIQSVESGIYVTKIINDDSLINKIYNNTIRMTSSYSFGVYLSYTGLNAVVEIMNNVIGHTSSTATRGVLINSFQGTLNIYYNHITATANVEISGTPTYQGNNGLTNVFNVNLNGATPSSLVDAGNPDLSFSDIDLSPGDPGAYGGSFTLDNYFPLFNGSSRVYHLEWESQLRQGNSLNIKGYSYDR